ncbi:hypothetical protein [Marinobacter halophilus]|uniref:hypothetical protein n=1 Tax=Marinobacter halophilus TaxID=1323740 RepID=UPI001056F67D|nr:hypothetical protein [Marinobacter halophilus]
MDLRDGFDTKRFTVGEGTMTAWVEFLENKSNARVLACLKLSGAGFYPVSTDGFKTAVDLPQCARHAEPETWALRLDPNVRFATGAPKQKRTFPIHSTIALGSRGDNREISIWADFQSVHWGYMSAKMGLIQRQARL